MTMLFRAPFVVLDTETTGFPSHAWAHVIELAGVWIDRFGAEMGEPFSRLIRPPVLDSRADTALRINGITREMIDRDGIDSEEAAGEFTEWSARAWLTSYNVAFDRPMCERMGITDRQWAPCIMERAMAVMGPAGALRPADPSHPRFEPGRPWLWPSLVSAAEFFSVPAFEPAHRALSDARRAAGVLVALRRWEIDHAAK